MAIAWLDNKKEISIHALREEGDGAADLIEAVQNDISIHALREEGDPLLPVYCIGKKYFYPRPPRGGRLLLCEISARLRSISIHALREEGDSPETWTGRQLNDFYPRPPRGGRPLHYKFELRVFVISIHALREEGDTGILITEQVDVQFLSTPSARRATPLATAARSRSAFLSTPSARRATAAQEKARKEAEISIHALREEGDQTPCGTFWWI